jgi:hypothetical protein
MVSLMLTSKTSSNDLCVDTFTFTCLSNAETPWRDTRNHEQINHDTSDNELERLARDQDHSFASTFASHVALLAQDAGVLALQRKRIPMGGHFRAPMSLNSVGEVHSEMLANIIFHLTPRETCTVATVCRSWHSAVALSGRLRAVLSVDANDCCWSSPILARLFSRFSRLEELHFSTDVLLPLEAVKSIAHCFASSLRCLSAFIVSNSAQGRQPAVSELAKITTLQVPNMLALLAQKHKY